MSISDQGRRKDVSELAIDEPRTGREVGVCGTARRSVLPGGLRLSLVTALTLSFWNPVAAQNSGGEAASSADASLPTVTQATTRAELLELLNQVQTQLEAAGADASPGTETGSQLEELRSQLEVLLLQAQLEQLQRENADLQEQLSETSAQGNGADPAVLEQQLTQLRARQDNMNTQMEVIAHQHAEILEYADLEEDEAQTHVVRLGDTLSELALTYYDDPARWPEILAANPDVTDPDMLLPGTTLLIPALEPSE